jgi:hypothetical protein
MHFIGCLLRKVLYRRPIDRRIVRIPPSLVLLAHRFVAAPRNTESIPSSPRLALGQKPGDLRDPDDASVNKSRKAQTLIDMNIETKTR